MPRIDPTLYVSIQTGARLAGVAKITIREAIKSGRIKGVELDGYYFALRSDCEAFERDPVGRGRPRLSPAQRGPRGAPRRWSPKAGTDAGKVDPAKYMSVGAAAKACNVSRYWMRKLIKDGQVAGIQIEGQFFPLRSAVEAYAATPAAHGRPRGGTHAS